VTGSTYNGEVDYVGNTVMPEPGTLGLLGLGGIMMMRRRRPARVDSRARAVATPPLPVRPPFDS
jgi:hypothetical protein